MFGTEPSVMREPDADTALEASSCETGSGKTTGFMGGKEGRGQKQVSNREQKGVRQIPKSANKWKRMHQT